MLTFLLDRLKERSTWLGLMGFLTAAGITLSPAQADQIVAAGIALASLIAVFTKD